MKVLSVNFVTIFQASDATKIEFSEDKETNCGEREEFKREGESDSERNTRIYRKRLVMK